MEKKSTVKVPRTGTTERSISDLRTALEYLATGSRAATRKSQFALSVMGIEKMVRITTAAMHRIRM
jgi:hypothetical protein